jgi:hypothetical protein
MAINELENPYYNNYIFSEFDLGRAKIKWWQYPILWFLPTYIQLGEGWEFHYKKWNGKYYLIKAWRFPKSSDFLDPIYHE